MAAATIILAALLLCAYMARWVNPATVWFFAFAGLAAPVLYVANTVLALYWTIRWRKWAFLPLAALALGVGSMSLFFRPSPGREHPADVPGRKITVATYNVMGFLIDTPDGRRKSCLEESAGFIRSLEADILCLQEFQVWDSDRKSNADKLLDYPHNTANYSLKNKNGYGWGLAIYSKYPIIRSGAVEFDNSTNSMLWADVRVGRDTLRVFNNHLQTTSVTTSDREYISTQEIIRDNEGREKRVRGILGKLRRNNRIRAAQVDTLAPLIEASPHRSVVCGDFNDTPMSYTYFQMRGDLRDAFVEKGRGMNSNTFRGLFNMFRIDYIFHSRSLRTASYDTPSSDYSDHKAVRATISLQEKR